MTPIKLSRLILRSSPLSNAMMFATACGPSMCHLAPRGSILHAPLRDNKIYMAGGHCTLGIPFGTSLAEVYDPALDECKSLPNTSMLRYK